MAGGCTLRASCCHLPSALPPSPPRGALLGLPVAAGRRQQRCLQSCARDCATRHHSTAARLPFAQFPRGLLPAGTRTGITCAQLDVKLPGGVPLDVVQEAVHAATRGRAQLLTAMERVVPRVRTLFWGCDCGHGCALAGLVLMLVGMRRLLRWGWVDALALPSAADSSLPLSSPPPANSRHPCRRAPAGAARHRAHARQRAGAGVDAGPRDWHGGVHDPRD